MLDDIGTRMMREGIFGTNNCLRSRRARSPKCPSLFFLSMLRKGGWKVFNEWLQTEASSYIVEVDEICWPEKEVWYKLGKPDIHRLVATDTSKMRGESTVDSKHMPCSLLKEESNLLLLTRLLSLSRFPAKWE